MIRQAIDAALAGQGLKKVAADQYVIVLVSRRT